MRSPADAVAQLTRSNGRNLFLSSHIDRNFWITSILLDVSSKLTEISSGRNTSLRRVHSFPYFTYFPGSPDEFCGSWTSRRRVSNYRGISLETIHRNDYDHPSNLKDPLKIRSRVPVVFGKGTYLRNFLEQVSFSYSASDLAKMPATPQRKSRSPLSTFRFLRPVIESRVSPWLLTSSAFPRTPNSRCL